MTSTKIKIFAAAFFSLFAVSSTAAAACETQVFEDIPMTVCRADPAHDDIRLWHSTSDGQIYGSFERVRRDLASEGKDLGFAMNGGMYHDDLSPVGHFLTPEGEQRPVITQDGPGNFGLLPNGVFCLGAGWASVTESRAFADAKPECRYATQSGPMLVIDGQLHPRFIPDGTSRYIRNGVGVTVDGQVVAVISERPVNFHSFGRFFRDVLNTPNALYMDGKVSRLYSSDLGRSDFGFPMGPILGTVVPAD